MKLPKKIIVKQQVQLAKDKCTINHNCNIHPK